MVTHLHGGTVQTVSLPSPPPELSLMPDMRKRPPLDVANVAEYIVCL
jgi:hypothetical protein